MKLLGGLSSVSGGASDKTQGDGQGGGERQTASPPPIGFNSADRGSAAASSQGDGPKHNVMADVIMRHESISNRIRNAKK